MCWLRNRGKLNIRRFLKKASRWHPFEIQKYEELCNHFKTTKTEAKPRRLGLKLIVISDTHGHLAFDKTRFPAFMDTVGDYDLCVLLGDMHPAELPMILDCIPSEKIIALKGNHDAFDTYSRFGIREISGTSYECKGVRFVGLDGSFRYKTEHFPSHTQHESLRLACNLPKADVLLTHDVMLWDFAKDPAHSGLVGITYYLFEHAPVWHLHGHIHKSYEKQYENGTKEKSVYLCEYLEL